MPSDALLKTTNSVHRFALRLTRGRVGWKLKGMPVVQLTTTGRKSGVPRTVMLTSPYQEGDTVVVVGSRGGDDKPPAWLLNVESSGHVQVSMNGKDPVPYLARVADASERARLWPLVTKDHPHYAGYQTKTDREIPLVLLSPASSS